MGWFARVVAILGLVVGVVLTALSRGRGEDRVDVLVNVTSEPLPAPSALVDGWDVLHSVVVGSTVPGRSTLWVRPS